MRLLLQKTVSVSEIETAHLMIYKFVALIPKLYGVEHREGRRGDGHIGQGWVLRFKAKNHNNSSPHLESKINLQHHIQKRYTYAIDNDINVHRQLEPKV
ncbi:hypothetical protein OUZ56_016557 [Daphnia magna]|uniref:Uncharacterized protein n=1 Tax=Daphnia magna TaxID=35525 RepID=A0ABR0AQW6_9CRUS|nr:hypothetical protein OUZ56_016557 [Daphnia magna]